MSQVLKVNPTRVNLLRLKKELKTAKKGHKLLKDKRDGLMQEFMGRVREVKDLRARLNPALIAAFTRKQAYDFRGKAITPLGSYIPTKFVEGEKPVSLMRSEYINARG